MTSTMTERRPRGAASDWELLRRSAEDPDAFGEFYERHFDSILHFLYRRTACVETAADLTAETFAAAFLARKRFRDMGRPARAWLLAIARHKLAHMLRHARAERKAQSRLGVPSVAVDELSYERIEALVDLGPLKEEVRQAIRELSPAVAEAVYLRVCLELPYPEIAQRLDCSEGAARVRVMRGLSKLSHQLEVA
jgi:RNA polymerase sigma factor (sigma-70 family)